MISRATVPVCCQHARSARSSLTGTTYQYAASTLEVRTHHSLVLGVPRTTYRLLLITNQVQPARWHCLCSLRVHQLPRRLRRRPHLARYHLSSIAYQAYHLRHHSLITYFTSPITHHPSLTHHPSPIYHRMASPRIRYTGGLEDGRTPTYESVCARNNTHTEAVRLVYQPLITDHLLSIHHSSCIIARRALGAARLSATDH